jgi:hypothetical protein
VGLHCSSRNLLSSSALQFRNPVDLGGAYYAFTMLLNLLIWFVSARVYTTHYEGPGKLASTHVYAFFGTLSGLWVVAVIGFLLSINREYVSTFVSFDTGSAYIIRLFSEAEGNDARRVKILDHNIRKWDPIRSEVQSWVKSSYNRWKTEQREWMTEGFIARLPPGFVPEATVVVNLHPAPPAPLVPPAPGVQPAGIDLEHAQDCVPKVCMLSEPAQVRRHKGVRGLDGDVPCANDVHQPGMDTLLAARSDDIAVAANTAAPAVARESTHPKWLPFYRCENHCGFTGTFNHVARHEASCARRTAASASRREVLDGT